MLAARDCDDDVCAARDVHEVYTACRDGLHANIHPALEADASIHRKRNQLVHRSLIIVLSTSYSNCAYNTVLIRMGSDNSGEFPCRWRCVLIFDQDQLPRTQVLLH